MAVEPSSGDIVRDISDSNEAGSLSKITSRSFTSFLAYSVSSEPSEGHETRGATVPSAIQRTRTALNLAAPAKFKANALHKLV